MSRRLEKDGAENEVRVKKKDCARTPHITLGMKARGAGFSYHHVALVDMPYTPVPKLRHNHTRPVSVKLRQLTYEDHHL